MGKSRKRDSRYATERFENPKVYDPYVIHRPFIFRWKGSVIPKILPQTFFVTSISVIVTCAHQLTSVKLGMQQQSFIAVLGIVVSLLLAYRTNTAYDKYWEGLRIWSNMVIAIRNMTRCIWVNVNEEDYEADTEKVIDDKVKAEHLVEKKTAINLLLGFALATKHYLREEPVKFEDIKTFMSKSDTDSQITIGRENHETRSTKSGKSGFSTDFIKKTKNLLPTFETRDVINHNLPLELTLYISSYINKQKKSGTTDDATIGLLYSNLGVLVESLTHFERILRSPIPLAYAIHLTQVTWIYCISLPFQLVIEQGWVTIPVTFLITLVLLGVEKIASEIENPFGWDENDLDLDDFCGLLNRELQSLTSEPIPPANEWIFTKKNTPFESESITALQARDLNLDEVKSLLSVTSPRQSLTIVNIEDNLNDVVVKEENLSNVQ